MNKVKDRILKLSEAGGKFYDFDKTHDPTKPAQMWFQNAEEGLVLFLVLYTQACQWSKCLGCNLPSKSSLEHISWRMQLRQIEHVFNDPEVQKKRHDIQKVILSNNGSVLDEETFSSTALMDFVKMFNLHFPNLSVLTLETRPVYVHPAELEFLARGLAEGDTPTYLEMAIGFEAFDDHIRNDVFEKGLSLEKFEELVAGVAEHREQGFRMKCYFMQKPVPGMTDDEAVEDIKNGIDYLSRLSEKHKVQINMHLNVTYVAFGTLLETAFKKGQYKPPYLEDVRRAVLHAEGKGISIYVGLFDEGLAVKGGSFIREGDEPLRDKLEQFNMTQDFSLLK